MGSVCFITIIVITIIIIIIIIIISFGVELFWYYFCSVQPSHCFCHAEYGMDSGGKETEEELHKSLPEFWSLRGFTIRLCVLS